MCYSAVDRKCVGVALVVVWWFSLTDEEVSLASMSRKKVSRVKRSTVVALAIGVVVANCRACGIVSDYFTDDERMRCCARVNDEITDARASSNGITTVGIEVGGGGGNIVAPRVVKAETVGAYVRDVNRAFVVADSVGEIGSSGSAIELGDKVWSSVGGLPLVTYAAWSVGRGVAS